MTGPVRNHLPRRPASAVKVQFVVLADQVNAEAAVGFLVDEAESSREVDGARRHEWIVRPQHHPLIAVRAGKPDADIDQTAAEPMPASGRIDEEDAQLRRTVIRGNAEDAADALAPEFRDPRCFPGRIMLAGVVSHDAGDQCLEGAIPTELPRVELAVRGNDPAEVARLIKLTDPNRPIHHDRLVRHHRPHRRGLLKHSFQCDSSRMTDMKRAPSARRGELLDAAYRYALAHGLVDLSLRPLAAAIGSSPRVLLFLFGSKDGLVRELLHGSVFSTNSRCSTSLRGSSSDPNPADGFGQPSGLRGAGSPTLPTGHY